MIEKVKLNEVAKDLNISGKDLTALLQERFGGEAKKPQTVQLVALILMCNLAHSRCEQMSGAEGGGQAALWILSGLLLAVGGILEAIMKAKMVISVLR